MGIISILSLHYNELYLHKIHRRPLSMQTSVFSEYKVTLLKLDESADRLCGLVVRVPDYTSRGTGFDSRRYQIFWEVVGLERVQLSLVRIIVELFEWKCSGSGLEKPILTALGIGCTDHATPLYPQNLALTSPTSGGISVGIVRLRTESRGV
jgi:hypothetical protein